MDGYHVSYHEGNLPGRNGVALLTRQAPLAIREGFGYARDAEGRYLEVDLPGLRVASLYLPKGGIPRKGGDELARFQRKLHFLRAFRPYLTRARREAHAAGLEFLVMGDFNIAPTELDLKNPRANLHNPGFLPEEREWMASILFPRTLVDVVRRLHPGEKGPFRGGGWRGQSWNTDAGWRIDLQLASPGLAARAVNGGTDKADSYESRMSDHAPVVVDYTDADTGDGPPARGAPTRPRRRRPLLRRRAGRRPAARSGRPARARARRVPPSRSPSAPATVLVRVTTTSGADGRASGRTVSRTSKPIRW